MGQTVFIGYEVYGFKMTITGYPTNASTLFPTDIGKQNPSQTIGYYQNWSGNLQTTARFEYGTETAKFGAKGPFVYTLKPDALQSGFWVGLFETGNGTPIYIFKSVNETYTLDPGVYVYDVELIDSKTGRKVRRV